MLILNAPELKRDTNFSLLLQLFKGESFIITTFIVP